MGLLLNKYVLGLVLTLGLISVSWGWWHSASAHKETKAELRKANDRLKTLELVFDQRTNVLRDITDQLNKRRKVIHAAKDECSDTAHPADIARSLRNAPIEDSD